MTSTTLFSFKDKLESKKEARRNWGSCSCSRPICCVVTYSCFVNIHDSIKRCVGWDCIKQATLKSCMRLIWLGNRRKLRMKKWSLSHIRWWKKAVASMTLKKSWSGWPNAWELFRTRPRRKLTTSCSTMTSSFPTCNTLNATKSSRNSEISPSSLLS